MRDGCGESVLKRRFTKEGFPVNRERRRRSEWSDGVVRESGVKRRCSKDGSHCRNGIPGRSGVYVEEDEEDEEEEEDDDDDDDDDGDECMFELIG